MCTPHHTTVQCSTREVRIHGTWEGITCNDLQLYFKRASARPALTLIRARLFPLHRASACASVAHTNMFYLDRQMNKRNLILIKWWQIAPRNLWNNMQNILCAGSDTNSRHYSKEFVLTRFDFHGRLFTPDTQSLSTDIINYIMTALTRQQRCSKWDYRSVAKVTTFTCTSSSDDNPRKTNITYAFFTSWLTGNNRATLSQHRLLFSVFILPSTGG